MSLTTEAYKMLINPPDASAEQLMVKKDFLTFLFVPKVFASKNYHYTIRNNLTQQIVARIYFYQNRWIFDQLTGKFHDIKELLEICEFMADIL